MSLWRGYAVFITGAVLGWVAPLTPPSVGAAPQDVRGSANVALDVFHNRSGSFVLWANGRITRSDGNAQDLGRPYALPAPSAELPTPTPLAGEPLGATWLPVKALVRRDGTYILFADGTLRRPRHSDAAAGAAGGGGGVITGGWDVNDYITRAPRDLGPCTLQFVGINVRITVDEPLTTPCEGFALAFGSYYPFFHTLTPGSDGRTFDFPMNRTPMQITGGYFMIRERR
jgi:hypothetical protein